VIIEAMLAGLPIVASDVGGNSELLDDGRCGFLCPFGDVTGFTRAVATVLRDPELSRQMGRRASGRAAANFLVGSMERATAAVYAETVCARSAQQREQRPNDRRS
jgi:glycosyltransferase involved in cell wall biosynthesis